MEKPMHLPQNFPQIPPLYVGGGEALLTAQVRTNQDIQSSPPRYLMLGW